MHDDPPGLVRRPGHVFRDSGMVLVRDGVRPDSTLLWMVADPRLRTAHGHLDFTSFQLWVRGQPLVQDTSGYAYRIENVLPGERAFYYSPFGHSLLTVDDYSPVPMDRLGDIYGWWGNEIPAAVIEEATLRGVRGRVVCSHDAYPGMKVVRTFTFDLGECWVEVTDRVHLDDPQHAPHVFRQLFHLGFGVMPRSPRAQRLAHVQANGTSATFTWETSSALTISARKSKFVKRAAEVFGLPQPYLLAAEVKTDAREVSIACRIRWN